MVKKANSYKDQSMEMYQKLDKSYIRPKLEFEYSIWNPYSVGDIELLESVQLESPEYQ